MTLAKKQKVIDYQEAAIIIIRSMKPRGWAPAGQVRLRYWFHLARDIDCDNAMKAIHDALQIATGVDDKRFLPCVMEKQIGLSGKEALVRVVVEDLE
jgi:Holliday junction resolvase RusA-like endonuclease